MIPIQQYTQIVDVLPILCVDVIVRNSEGEYLLVKRRGEPLKGQWWVIGGRVLKGETLEQAVARKARTEVGLTLRSVHAVGYYQEMFADLPFDVRSGLHAVSVVFSGEADGGQAITLDGQSVDWKYAKALPSGFRVQPFPGVSGLSRDSESDAEGRFKAFAGSQS